MQKIRNKVRRDSFTRYKDVAPPPLPNQAIMSALTGGKAVNIPVDLPLPPPPIPPMLEQKLEEEQKEGLMSEEIESKDEVEDAPRPSYDLVHKFALKALNRLYQKGLWHQKQSSFRRWRSVLITQKEAHRAGAERLWWTIQKRDQSLWQKKAAWKLLNATCKVKTLRLEVAKLAHKEMQRSLEERKSPAKKTETPSLAEVLPVPVTAAQLRATTVRFMFYRWKIWYQSRIMDALLEHERTSNERLLNRLSEISRRCEALEENSYAAQLVRATTTPRWEHARNQLRPQDA